MSVSATVWQGRAWASGATEKETLGQGTRDTSKSAMREAGHIIYMCSKYMYLFEAHLGGDNKDSIDLIAARLTNNCSRCTF